MNRDGANEDPNAAGGCRSRGINTSNTSAAKTRRSKSSTRWLNRVPFGLGLSASAPINAAWPNRAPSSGARTPPPPGPPIVRSGRRLPVSDLPGSGPLRLRADSPDHRAPETSRRNRAGGDPRCLGTDRRHQLGEREVPEARAGPAAAFEHEEVGRRQGGRGIPELKRRTSSLGRPEA